MQKNKSKLVDGLMEALKPLSSYFVELVETLTEEVEGVVNPKPDKSPPKEDDIYDCIRNIAAGKKKEDPEFLKYKHDFFLFLRSCGLESRAYQERAIKEMLAPNSVAIASPRQMGATSILSAYALWRSIFWYEVVGFVVDGYNSKTRVTSAINSLYNAFIKEYNYTDMTYENVMVTQRSPWGVAYKAGAIRVLDESDGNMSKLKCKTLLVDNYDDFSNEKSLEVVRNSCSKVVYCSCFSKKENTNFKKIMKSESSSVKQIWWRWYEIPRYVDGIYDPEGWKAKAAKSLGSEIDWAYQYEHLGILHANEKKN